MKRILYLLIVSLLVANCWQSSDKKENNEVTQANDIKENPKEDFGEEEMPKQSNDTTHIVFYKGSNSGTNIQQKNCPNYSGAVFIIYRQLD